MRTRVSGIQLGNYTIGDQSIEGGRYDSMNALGDLEAKNCYFDELSILGDAKLDDCQIRKLSVLGTAKVYGGRVDFVEITGELTLRGQVTAGGIQVLGRVHSEDTTCTILKFGSVRLAKIKRYHPLLIGKYQGESLESFFPLRLDEHQNFKNIFNAGDITSVKPIECDHFFSFARLHAPEINADMCYIYPCSNVKVDEIHGSVVIIDPCFDRSWVSGIKMDVDLQDMFNSELCRTVNIGSIAADEVVIDHCECASISANNVVIGANSKVDYVEYLDHCEIHAQAIVKEVVKL